MGKEGRTRRADLLLTKLKGLTQYGKKIHLKMSRATWAPDPPLNCPPFAQTAAPSAEAPKKPWSLGMQS